MTDVREWLLDLLYPSRCAFCRRLVPIGVKACEACRAKLPFLEQAAQSRTLTHIPRCVSPLRYEGEVRASLLRYKFGGLPGYAQIYGEFLAKCIDENDISCDSITWAPLSRARRRRRGYDQAQLLAQELAKRTGLPCERLLRKVRNNPAQSGIKNADARRKNVKGAYRALSPEKIRDKRILLIDDIVTSGSTLSECASVLRAAGAKEVLAATVASARKD